MTLASVLEPAPDADVHSRPDGIPGPQALRYPCVLVGAGPGDPDLLTIKAVKALRRATVVLVDDLVDRRVLRWTRRSARVVDVGKRGGCRSTPQAFIEKLMIREVLRGERVVRLKGGDPLVFGRAGEEIAALAAAGLAVEVINGITSGLAAASDLGISLTHRDCAKGVMFITGHGRQDGGSMQVDWQQVSRTAAGGITLVIYMGLARLEQVREGLLTALPSWTPVALVERASQASGRQVLGSLQDLPVLAARHWIASPAILVVGKVLEEVALAAIEKADAGGLAARSSPFPQCSAVRSTERFSSHTTASSTA
jgi:uroporphyrin-III C-methyltransferase